MTSQVYLQSITKIFSDQNHLVLLKTHNLICLPQSLFELHKKTVHQGVMSTKNKLTASTQLNMP